MFHAGKANKLECQNSLQTQTYVYTFSGLFLVHCFKPVTFVCTCKLSLLSPFAVNQNLFVNPTCRRPQKTNDCGDGASRIPPQQFKASIMQISPAPLTESEVMLSHCVRLRESERKVHNNKQHTLLLRILESLCFSQKKKQKTTKQKQKKPPHISRDTSD